MTIADVHFSTKGAAEKHAKAIRRRYLDKPGVPFSPADHAFIVDYTVQLHPEAEEKIGMGVREVVILDVPNNYRHGVNGADGRVLHFVRHDGTRVVVGLSGRRTHRGDVMAAFRWAAGQPPRADVCDSCDSREGPFHAHHVDYQFAEIAMFFLQSKALKFNDIELVKKGVHPRLADDQLSAEWILFHGQYAEYETLCRRCHYSDGHGWDYKGG